MVRSANSAVLQSGTVRVPQVQVRDYRNLRFWYRLVRQPAAMLALLVLVVLVFTALAAPLIAPGSPFAQSNTVLKPPSAAHPFGTDDLGRDIFRGVIHGTRISLLIGFGSACAAMAIGMLIGSTAGYFGGLVDDGLMRLTELFQIVPRFFLALIAVALLGSHTGIVLALLAFTFWPSTARLLRGQVLAQRSREYVLAARAIGVPDPLILARHVLPGALPAVITQLPFQVGGAILVEAGLAFLGLGDRNVVSWGGLLNNAQQFVRQAWWMSAFPGVALTITILCLNLLADGLNEAWNPRITQSGR